MGLQTFTSVISLRNDGDRISLSTVVRNAEATLFARTSFRMRAQLFFVRLSYEAVGGADEDYRICGDWKLWAAMAVRGKVAYFGEPLNFFRFHDASVRNTSKYDGRDVAEYLKVIRWLLDQVTPSDEVLEAMRISAAGRWVPAVDEHARPSPTKLTILQNASVVDPHPLRRMIRPALETIRQKVSRHLPFPRQKDPKTMPPDVGWPHDE